MKEEQPRRKVGRPMVNEKPLVRRTIRVTKDQAIKLHRTKNYNEKLREAIDKM